MKKYFYIKNDKVQFSSDLDLAPESYTVDTDRKIEWEVADENTHYELDPNDKDSLIEADLPIPTPEAYKESAAEMVRGGRIQLLNESDWTQTVDSPLSESKKEEWKTYRQALRDLSKTAEPKIDHETYTLINVTFPTRPDEE